MEIVPLVDEHRAAWDEFCAASPDAWFWHTTAWLDYNLAYHPGLRPRQLSFLCKEGDRVMAAVPLMLSHHENGGTARKHFSLGGNPLPIPALPPGLSASRRAKMHALIFELIEGLAVELGVSYSAFQIEFLAPAQLKPERPPFNFPLKHGYLDCSLATQLIDLRPPEAELWEDVRRDHQRNVEKARESLTAVIHAGRGLTDAKFDEYRLMHARAAGRVTRPLETFRLMREWIQAGRGFLTEVRLPDGRPVGFETFHYYKNAVYSMSACNEPGFEQLPIRHLVQWESLRRMKADGYEFYDVGAQRFGALPYDAPDAKLMAICLFKGGFGGTTVPHLRAERFHDRSYWEDEQTRRSTAFSEHYAWTGPADARRARELLALLERAGKAPEPRPGETEPIPESARALAAEAAEKNPDAVQKHRNGSTKAVAFLVGAAMQRAPKGTDPRLVRRAIEEYLTKA